MWHGAPSAVQPAVPQARWVSFNVVTGETTASDGAVLRSFVEFVGDTGNNGRCFAAVDERRCLLAPDSEGGGEVDAARQASRINGHCPVDLLALENIGVLNGVRTAAGIMERIVRQPHR